MINQKIINKNALINNLNYCKKSNKTICAMVKADAYGHGMKNIVKILNNEKVEWFGVSNYLEAIQTKKIAPNSNVVIVSKSQNYSQIITQNISFTVDSIKELEKVLLFSIKLQKIAKVHIAINTGMNRIGVSDLNSFKQMLEYIDQNSKYILLEGVFTHCFDADCSKTHFYKQMKTFYEYVKYVNNKNTIIHIGGSFVLKHKLPSFVQMVRVGMFLYGYGCSSLKPVMQIKSQITKITNCKAGSYVGYGNKTILKQDALVALVPVGYADGYPRALSNSGYVIINNQKAKVIGNVCMDALMVIGTNIKCKVGDEVLLLENAMQISKIANMSIYETLTNYQKFRAKCLIC